MVTVKAVLNGLRGVYSLVDRMIRYCLGEKKLLPYRPTPTADKRTLLAVMHNDFSQELPSRLQEVLLNVYLRSKHIVAVLLKSLIKAVRGK